MNKSKKYKTIGLYFLDPLGATVTDKRIKRQTSCGGLFHFKSPSVYMRMWEVLFTILSYNAMLVRPRLIKYVRSLSPTNIPRCKDCIYFLPENINTGQTNQCKKLGQINPETKELEYSFAAEERFTGRCGPKGFYFESRSRRDINDFTSRK
jgi:hypothetical protein